MKISITGTPGTGKTSVSKKLSENLSLDYVSVNDLARERDCIEGVDDRRDSEIIDIECLKKVVLDLEDCVLDGHLSHFLDSGYVFVLRCEPGELRSRLEEKGWNSSKVKENVDAEVLGVIDSESREENDKVYSVDTTDRSVEEAVEYIVDVIENGKVEEERIDWMEDGDIL